MRRPWNAQLIVGVVLLLLAVVASPIVIVQLVEGGLLSWALLLAILPLDLLLLLVGVLLILKADGPARRSEAENEYASKS